MDKLVAEYKPSPNAQADANQEVAKKARLGGWIYLVGVVATILGTPQLTFHNAPEILFTLFFVLLIVWREVAYRLVTRDRQSALDNFWIYRCSFMALAIVWISFVLYVLGIVGQLAGGPAVMVVATAGFSTGTLMVLVPHLKIIKIFLAIMLLVPAAFLPFLLDGLVKWMLIAINVPSFFFLYDISRKQTKAYWQQVHFAEEFKQQAESLKISEEKAQAASLAKSDFLAKMSHEIRTPMNGVIGMVQLLDQSTVDQQQKQFIDIIRSSGKALLRIIDDILDFSKLEAGKMQLSPKATDLGIIVSDIQSIFLGQAQDKQLDIRANIQSLDEKRVFVDGLRIQQILFNLVGNAVKFTEQGHITIDLQYVIKDDNYCDIHLSVSDTGIGIATDHQSLIFEQFEQAEDSNSLNGTGLGLSICKRLVELMNGTITIESELHKGSIFHVTLPARLLDQDTGDAESPLTDFDFSPPAKELFAALKVLVVEDNPVNQQVIKYLLKHIGCQVEIIDDGHEAVSALKAQPFSLVLMDCDMPKLDGYETTRQIRAWEKAANRRPVPIIALTAHVIDSVRKQCYEAGMDNFLIKPATLPKLKELLTQYAEVNA